MSATEPNVASGLAIPLPAMSGAEPCTGSYRPGPPAPRLAEASSPIDPAIIAASSERMSPNMFSVSTTSKAAGFEISCIAALSTSRCSSRTSGWSRATCSTVSRHRREVSRMFALSTEVTRPRLDGDAAIPNARRAMRSTSPAEYTHVSWATPLRRPRSPK